MKERPDVRYLNLITNGIPRNERSYIVWEELSSLTFESQIDLTLILDKELFTGEVQSYKSLIISNSIALKATKALILSLLERDDILYILDDSPKFTGDDAFELNTTQSQLDDIAWSIEHIGAPRVWQEGFTGEGVLLAIIDTGVSWQHVDITNQLWDGGEEYPYHGYDFQEDDLDPDDTYGHGTAVAGIIAGDGTAGDTTGIAPDARVMCLRVRENLSIGVVTSTWAAQDFALEHGVDVTSMSLGWGSPGEEDRQIWRNNYDVLNAAGIVNIKSGGNRRLSTQPPGAISVPGDVPSPWRHPDEIESGNRGGLITVGATDEDDELNRLSSPGPVTWQTEDPWLDYLLDSLHVGLIKPDLSAPGTNGRTLNSGNDSGYVSFLNTSMAQPHVAGVVALMLSKNPELLPVEVDSILQTTALDLGDPGKDNDYGAGRVQAFEAIQATPHSSSVDEMKAPLPFDTEVISALKASPNPFNADSIINFKLMKTDRLTLLIHNYLGQQITRADLGYRTAGDISISWLDILPENKNLASGIYLMTIRGSNSYKTIKIALMK